MNKALIASLTLVWALAGSAYAQQGSPTGVCKDGSNYYGASKSGACSHHGGVKEWYGAGGAAPAAPAAGASSSSPAPAAPAAAPAAPAPAPAPAAPAPKTSSHTTTSSGSGAAQAPGGGPGLVWVNTASKVYHCNGTRYYGKTKQGKYVTEAEAKSEGDRPDHGKPCS
jgi:hypothetical protein